MDKILAFLKKSIFTILLFLYLAVVAFLPNDFVFSGNILLSIIALMCLNLILAKGKWWLTVVPTIILVFFISLSAFFSFMYSSWVWTESLLSILRTNAGEASEMTLSFLLPGLLILAVSIVLVLLSQRELRGLKAPFVYASSVVVVAYSFLFLPFMINRIIERIEFRSIWDSPVMNAQYSNMFAPVVYGNLFSSYAAITEIGKIKRLLETSENKTDPQGIVLTDSISSYKRIVIVLGESSNKNHYSLYGYDRPTTPFLDSLHLSNSATLQYFDAISPASSTVLSLFRSLSFASLADVSAAYTTKSIIDLANDAGYTSYWISAQDPIGESNSEIGLLALSTSKQYYLSKLNDTSILDMNLIPHLQEYYGKEGKQLIILHLMGSHIYYSARIDEVDREAIADSDRNTNTYNSEDDYDRSIHHTDRVLQSIYKTIENDSTALMIYAADHAEIVGLGHGYNKLYKDQHEIPFISYNFTSQAIDSVLVKYSDNMRFNTVNMSYVLAECMGYQISDSLVDKARNDASKILLQSGEVVRFDDVKDK